MSEMMVPPHDHRSQDAVETAKDGLKRAERGDAVSTLQIDKARKSDPAGADAAEQEASDGPEGRGLSR